VGHGVAAKLSSPNSATGSTRPPRTTSPTGYQPTKPPRRRHQFGSPHAVAGAFAGELTTAYARRTIACFLATGPLVGIWWLLLLHPSPWRTGLIALLAAIPVIPLIIIAIATAGGTFATTGRLMRWLPETGPRRALAATIAIAMLCMIIDLTMITMVMVSGGPTGPLMIIAFAASLTRIVCSITTVRHASLMRV
jgi:hypothetical protein